MYIGLVVNIYFSCNSSNILRTDVFFNVIFPRRLSRRIIQNYRFIIIHIIYTYVILK